MGDVTHMERLHTNDLEIGATEAIQKHFARHVVATKSVSQRKLNFEHSRPRWLRECMAEATGVFFHVFPGIAAVTAFTINKEDAAFGFLFQVGWAFALGIAFAIITCASTSDGHFNPAVTICFAVWQGFPWKKVPCYIFSQIFGAFMAGLLLMGLYHEQLEAYAEGLRATGVTSMVFNGGPASVLCSFPAETQHNPGYLFLIEFFVDSYIGIIIWATLDPANPFISPSGAPFVIGLAYATMVWGFADITISTNLARDLGTRIVAAIFYGGEAFSYHNYSWIAILVNIPATLFATGLLRVLDEGQSSEDKQGGGSA
ncbi:Aquaporin-3 [Fulvia fulva]|uniref:Aquaporin-3 n=1 Tax=Passalora fulva TaxID=5499 RepID=A0A9Q8PG85_PASFU|nr:Aquaporin-3 [Fulvia fulva]KAK4614005.1 Aquaporin-3 [Fulvia fulva]KAK4614462.1 Aquaporin-3 [Fulvia fulva]UJO21930.1 Aquaporin-3 [Fulvia fulva]WPV20781.1 Aquaporin-3 [Fulvia fulva]WPV34758.1 Aquaporin-3 [Fulvia fulva]